MFLLFEPRVNAQAREHPIRVTWPTNTHTAFAVHSRGISGAIRIEFDLNFRRSPRVSREALPVVVLIQPMPSARLNQFACAGVEADTALHLRMAAPAARAVRASPSRTACLFTLVTLVAVQSKKPTSVVLPQLHRVFRR